MSQALPTTEARAPLGLRLLAVGQVQGVGFRPFVYRLACQCALRGWVGNVAGGVEMELEGRAADLAQFQARLVAEAPAAARIEGLHATEQPVVGHASFTIVPSQGRSAPQARVPRDLAVCAACRADIEESPNRRRGYPFTNCTACGPRYSIVSAMPYDRNRTAMQRFTMCGSCQSEYETPADRRFHAEPNACGACGPAVALWDRHGGLMAQAAAAIQAAAAALRHGEILALKGLGGFQLLVRADQANAVNRLRQRKQRPSKPLAVMVTSLEAARSCARLDSCEQAALQRPENPIVLLDHRGGGPLAAEVAPGVGTVGLLLPTTPLHHLLCRAVALPLIATSGNAADEPPVIDEREAPRRLGEITDLFLVHDRPILRRVDDSVGRVIAGRLVMLRLARGYAPLPLPALEARPACPPVLAVGGHQKNAVAVWTGAQAILSPHIGDLDGPETRAAFCETIQDLTDLYQCAPAVLACDLHPDYFPTRWARAQGKPVIAVQHHHAHAAAVMAEFGLLDREVLAFTWDGTGYGPDGTIWGGEALLACADRYRRVATLRPFPLPGGAAAIRHPGRTAFGLLSMLSGTDALECSPWLPRLGLTPAQARALASLLAGRTGTPWTTSVGRLFDAVAALVLGAATVSYEGEAALWLEAAADPLVTDAYPLPLESRSTDDVLEGDWRPLVREIMADLTRRTTVGVIAARFHNALANWAAAVAALLPSSDVVLAGGCFQNRLLAERTLAALQRTGRIVYLSSQVPPGDGGLAAGQLAVALAQLGEQAGC